MAFSVTLLLYLAVSVVCIVSYALLFGFIRNLLGRIFAFFYRKASTGSVRKYRINGWLYTLGGIFCACISLVAVILPLILLLQVLHIFLPDISI